MLDAALAVWSNAPQRATMAVDRLLALQLVTTEHATGWVFAHSRGVRSVADHVAIELSYELLQCILDKAVARTLVCMYADLLRTAWKTVSRRGLGGWGSVCSTFAAVGAFETTHVLAAQDAAEDLGAAEAAQQAAMNDDSDELDAKRAKLVTRQALQRDVLLSASRGFAGLLAGDAAALLIDLQDVQAKPKSEGQQGEGWTTEELQAHAVETWRDLTLARAQGVLRRYHTAVAPIVKDVKVRAGVVGFCRGLLVTHTGGVYGLR